MANKKPKQEVPIQDLEPLDALIAKCFGELNGAKSLNAKIGDFVKMMTLRYKLAPTNAEQKKLWQALQDIRRKGLASEKSAKNPAPQAKSPQSKSKGRSKS